MCSLYTHSASGGSEVSRPAWQFRSRVSSAPHPSFLQPRLPVQHHGERRLPGLLHRSQEEETLAVETRREYPAQRCDRNMLLCPCSTVSWAHPAPFPFPRSLGQRAALRVLRSRSAPARRRRSRSRRCSEMSKPRLPSPRSILRPRAARRSPEIMGREWQLSGHMALRGSDVSQHCLESAFD